MKKWVYGVLIGISAFAVACTQVTSRKKFRFVVLGDDPDHTLYDSTDEACVRWSNATGLDLAMTDDTKAPFTIRWATPEEMPFDPDGIHKLGGVTFPATTLIDGSKAESKANILVRNDIPSEMIVAVVAHEIGHILAYGELPHASTGVFSAPTVDPNAPINEDTLMQVCKRLNCAFVRPEPDPKQQT